MALAQSQCSGISWKPKHTTPLKWKHQFGIAQNMQFKWIHLNDNVSRTSRTSGHGRFPASLRLTMWRIFCLKATRRWTLSLRPSQWATPISPWHLFFRKASPATNMLPSGSLGWFYLEMGNHNFSWETYGNIIYWKSIGWTDVPCQSRWPHRVRLVLLCTRPTRGPRGHWRSDAQLSSLSSSVEPAVGLWLSYSQDLAR